jgi:hypothetical protein
MRAATWRTLSAGPVAAALYGAGALGAALDGWAHAVLPWSAVLVFGLVFMAGWIGIPVTGALATVLVAELPERWRPRVKRLFVGWTMAWIGTAFAVWIWGTPFSFA